MITLTSDNIKRLSLYLNISFVVKILQMELERAEKKDVKAMKTKNDDVSNVGEHDDDENSLEELKSRFEQVKKQIL